jgi:hypothetical protein
MVLGLLLIIFGIFILYVIFDYIVMHGGDINNFGKKWLKKILWIWLPFHGFYRLYKEVVLKKK